MALAKILVIEDNPAEIELLRRALDTNQEAYDLDVLEDGEAAMRYVRQYRNGALPPEPCVIVLDLFLPRHSGMEVLAALREEPALNHIRTIVLTSVASPDQIAEIQSLGASYREKPLHLAGYMDLATYIIELCKGTAVEVA